MTRNFYDPKHYVWKDDGNMLVCVDRSGETLFAVFDEGRWSIALNAYHAGLSHGKGVGRASMRREIKALLEIDT